MTSHLVLKRLDYWALLHTVSHVQLDTRLPRFSACNIDKLGGAWERDYPKRAYEANATQAHTDCPRSVDQSELKGNFPLSRGSKSRMRSELSEEAPALV